MTTDPNENTQAEIYANIRDKALEETGQTALLEQAALIAEAEWTTYADAKAAHERLSPEPFRPNDFNISWSGAMRSREMARRIRALKRRNP